MKNIPKLQWVGSMHEGIPVATDNLDACIKFYPEVLGLKLLVQPTLSINSLQVLG